MSVLRPGTQGARVLMIITREPQTIDDLIRTLGLSQDRRGTMTNTTNHLIHAEFVTGGARGLTLTGMGEFEQQRLLALEPPPPPVAPLSQLVQIERQKLARVSARAQAAYAVLRQLNTRTPKALAAQGGYSLALAQEVWNELQRAGLT